VDPVEPKMKFALISEFLPPSPTWSGQAAIVHRLLSSLDPRCYCLLSRANVTATDGGLPPLPGRYYHLGGASGASPEQANGLERWAIRMRRAGSALRVLIQAAFIARRERCAALVATPDRVEDLPLAFAASRLARIRFYPYLFDDYANKWTGARERRFARVVEPFLLRRSAGIVVPNELLQEELRKRYGVVSTVVPNVYDPSLYDADAAEPDYGAEAAIVFTGAVYHAHYGAFRTLVAGLRLLEGRSARLHLYTASDEAQLEREGICGPVAFHAHVPSSAVPRIQQEAHILFLPLAFDSPYPEVVRTSSPAKMAEYMASGRPILVHAPPDAFISTYFRHHRCGVVVDESDPRLLAEAIERILGDTGLRNLLSAAARERAVADFHPARGRAAFAQLLGLPVGDS
jgi:glycosyltransferase involved in cell wall biosynthesis